jgi:hypothetical protein
VLAYGYDLALIILALVVWMAVSFGIIWYVQTRGTAWPLPQRVAAAVVWSVAAAALVLLGYLALTAGVTCRVRDAP